MSSVETSLLGAIARVDKFSNWIRNTRGGRPNIFTGIITLATIHDSWNKCLVAGKRSIATPIFADLACGSRASIAPVAAVVDCIRDLTGKLTGNGIIGSKFATDTINIALRAQPLEFPALSEDAKEMVAIGRRRCRLQNTRVCCCVSPLMLVDRDRRDVDATASTLGEEDDAAFILIGISSHRRRNKRSPRLVRR